MKINKETRVKLQKQIKEAKLPKETKDTINRLLDDTKLGLKLYFEESEEKTKNKDGELVPLSSLYYTYFEEDKSKRIINNREKENHLLIEGDNYFALKHLKKIGQKVDIIYIDPPYNTGNEFIYNDKLIGKDDAFKHSFWLSFMRKRLEIARGLMSDNAVIFVSIDDNEQAYLKVLMDEIFGEDKFISCSPWEKVGFGNAAAGKMKQTKNLRRDHEYILIYGDPKLQWNKDLRLPQFKNKPDAYDDRGGFKAGSLKNGAEKRDFVNPITKRIHVSESGWQISLEEFNRLCDDDRIYWGKSGDGVPAIKIYHNEEKEYIPSSIFTNLGSLTSAKTDLKEILEEELIEEMTPKPIQLLEKIINYIPNKNAIVLDFFAGSSSTGEAVFSSNQKDNGNRKYIGITLGVDKNINISEQIAYERLKRITTGKDLNSENWIKENSPYNENLKYLIVRNLNKFDGNLNILNNNKDLYNEEFKINLTVELIADE